MEGRQDPAAWRVLRKIRCVTAGAGSQDRGKGSYRSADFTVTVLRALCNSELLIDGEASLSCSGWGPDSRCPCRGQALSVVMQLWEPLP